MASIFRKIFDRFKQNTTSGDPAHTTTLEAPSVTLEAPSAKKTPEAPAPLSISLDPTSPLYTKSTSTSRTLTDNSIDDIIKQINEIITSVDTSAQENFDVNEYLDLVKRGLQDLNGGQIQSDDVSKFTNMRTSEAQKEYEDAIGRGLDMIEQFTDPNSDVYKTMFNRALDRFDATAAATNMSQSMRIANNPYLTDSAKRVAGAELNRVTQSNRAALTGELTEQVNKMMFDAAEAFTTQSINAAEYEEGKFKTDADLAMREMTNRIATLQIQGDLSITEATLAYQQITDGIDNQWKNISAQLEKLALLLDSEEFKLKADEARTAAFDFWAEHSVNRIIELKKSNRGTITLDQVKNDPLTMSYLMKEMEMSGYDGDVDDYIQSRIDSAKTQVQIDQEAVDALIQTYMNSGMDEETATAFAEYYSQLKNGAIQNEDGSWYVPGADGKPIMTWDGEKFIFEDVNKDDSGADIPTEVGKTYTLEGKLYQVGEDGKGVEIQNGAYYTEGDIVYVNNNGVPTKVSTPTEIWGIEATSIIELGEGTKIYDEIMSKRKEEILTGTYNYEQLKSDPEKMSLAKKLATPIDTGTRPTTDDKRAFTSVPEKNIPFTYNGKTYMRVGDVGYQPVHGKGWDYQHYQVIDLDTGNVVWVDCKAGVFTIDGVPPQASTAGNSSTTEKD